MTPQEAIKILHPDTTVAAIAEIEYYAGFKGGEATIKAVEDACVVACEALEKSVPMKPKISSFGVMRCPKCQGKVGERVSNISYQNCSDYCSNCGQRINWGG